MPYLCRKTSQPPPLDATLTHPVWQAAEKSPRFVDMVTGGPAFYDTRAAALWDDDNLYVAFWAEEPFVRADLIERDSLIFQESDLELFIDGGDCYYEWEVNARGTIYEVCFIWKDAFDKFNWDLRGRNVHSFAGDYDRTPASFWRGTHPRGPRWAFLDFDMPGLRHAVHIDGTLNDDSDIDRGWTVELAIPWASLAPLANGRALPPREGDIWRVFFGRFQELTASGQEIQPHPAWVWTPHGIYDTHQPERWTEVQFTSAS